MTINKNEKKPKASNCLGLPVTNYGPVDAGCGNMKRKLLGLAVTEEDTCAVLCKKLDCKSSVGMLIGGCTLQYQCFELLTVVGLAVIGTIKRR